MTRACSACGQPFLECDCAAPAVVTAPAPPVPTIEALQREVAMLRTVNESLAAQARALLLAQPRPAHEQVDAWKREAIDELRADLRKEFELQVAHANTEADKAYDSCVRAWNEAQTWKHASRRMRGVLNSFRHQLKDRYKDDRLAGIWNDAVAALKAYKQTRLNLGDWHHGQPTRQLARGCECGWCKPPLTARAFSATLPG